MKLKPTNRYLKTPLDYQITEFDCGTTTILNALRYLFKREEISPIIYKEVMQYTLDKTDENGEFGKGGTSTNAVYDLAELLNKLGPKNKMNIKGEKYNGEWLDLQDQINENGVAILRVYQSVEHYVLLTKITKKCAYLFDPYYLPIHYYDKDKECEIIKDYPFSHNRKVKITRMLSEDQKDFSLVKGENSQIVLIKRS